MGKRRSVQPHVVESLEERRLLSSGAGFLASHVPVMHFRHLGHAHGTGYGTRQLPHQRLATRTAAADSIPVSPTTPDSGVTSAQPPVPAVNYLTTRGPQTLPSLLQTQAAAAASATGNVAGATTTATGSGSAAVPSSLVHADPIVANMPPMPIGGPSGSMPWFLGDVTLSKADLTLLKTTIDTFASAYTSGAGAAKDKAAVSALQQGMQSLSDQIWSENHLVGKDTIAALQQAVNNFAASYTGGKNVAQDSAAWTALQGGLGDFWKATSATGAGVDPTQFPAGLTVMPFGSASVMGGPLLGPMTGPFDLGQSPLSKDDVSKLQQAVDTFASAYTSGADAAKDKAAVTALESSLQELASSLWSAPMPQPRPHAKAMPLLTAPAATTAPSSQTSSASSTAATQANGSSGTS